MSFDSLEPKINTVVSQLNYKSYLGDFISQVRPNKWKIFKVLPSITDKYSITDEDFENYVARHQHFSHLIFSENNEEMTESYLMIDPLGRFFQNSNRGQGSYIYSKPIIKQGIKKAFDDIVFDVDKFFGRYQSKKIPIINI